MSRSARETAAAEFREHIRHSNELHGSYLRTPERLQQYDRFTTWQMRYLLTFFTDLHERPGYGNAIDFTVSDLAGVSVGHRDHDLERAAPAITRMLPTRALETIAAAARLNARVLELNLGVLRCLQDNDELPAEISPYEYCAAFRASSTFGECTELVGLAVSLGGTLKTLVKVRLLGALLHAMRGPAHAAGFGALQEFLENGYSTFREIPDIDLFLDEIEVRMNEYFETIFAVPSGEGE